MRAITCAAVAAFLSIPAAALAQPPAAAPSPNPISANARVQFGAISGFVVRAAEKVPEDLYAFRATPDVRTMGELFGHIADAMMGMCATAQGEKPPRSGFEKSLKTKADLQQALKEGVAYCNSVMEKMDDKRGAEPIQFYFGPTPRVSALYFVTTHTYEHYGNLVTYMRLKGIVPPSSEPAKPTK